MKNRYQLEQVQREEQKRYLVKGNPVRAADLVNRDCGVVGPAARLLIAAVPKRWRSRCSAFLRRRAARAEYLLTHSILVVRKPGLNLYYDLSEICDAFPVKDGQIQVNYRDGAYAVIGPLRRPALFAHAIRQAAGGAPPTVTCNQCVHYERLPAARDNAGRCRYYPLTLGNYDCCNHLATQRR